MKPGAQCVALVAVLANAGGGAAMAGDVVLTDGSFNPSNWSHTTSLIVTGGSVEPVFQEFSGGNPGAWLRSGQSVQVPLGSVAYGRGSPFSSLRVDPALTGSIIGFEAAMDVKLVSHQRGATMGVLVRQNNRFFGWMLTDTLPDVWTRVSSGPVSPTDPRWVEFVRSREVVVGSAPDFSPAGAVMTFGILCWQRGIASPIPYQTWYGVDNVQVTLDTCYADCDAGTGLGGLDIFDFLCFQNRFAANDPYACGCDVSTGVGVCDVFDFLCFQNAYDAGCR